VSSEFIASETSSTFTALLSQKLVCLYYFLQESLHYSTPIFFLCIHHHNPVFVIVATISGKEDDSFSSVASSHAVFLMRG